MVEMLPFKSMNFHKLAVCVPGTAYIHSSSNSCRTTYPRSSQTVSSHDLSRQLTCPPASPKSPYWHDQT